MPPRPSSQRCDTGRPALRPAQIGHYQSSRKKKTSESFCCCYRRPCSFWVFLNRAVASERTSPKAKLHRMDKTAHQQESRARDWDSSLAADCSAKPLEETDVTIPGSRTS